jgi:hypothetical protein
MTATIKNLGSPFSTGGGGPNFETRVQTFFTVLMMTDGVAPCLRPWSIKKIKLQAKRIGYNTDDLVVFTEAPQGGFVAKLLAQVKHGIAITNTNPKFQEIIDAAWADYNNEKLFRHDSDAIALITDPLNSTDAEVKTLLEWARHADDEHDFLKKVNQANFSSEPKRGKLLVLRECLSKAKGAPLSDEELWRFLRIFHLLEVDLDVDFGTTQALVFSLLRRHVPGEESAAWAMILDMVQRENQNEGTVTRDSLPADLKEKWHRHETVAIPPALAKGLVEQSVRDWSREPDAHDLGLAFLVGGWEESRKEDLEAGATLSKTNVDEWLARVRGLLRAPDSPLTLHNGKWATKDRSAVWGTLGKSIFDSDLDLFRKIAVDVLSERDPSFDIPKEERYMAAVKGKALSHSTALREGVADTLALLGARPKIFSNCSTERPETTADLAVRQILGGPDWQLWGSLNGVLPLLAEASPTEFLAAVEEALRRDPSPFGKLFAEEGPSLLGSNYLTGLLWGLESLAWDERFLIPVALILAGLAKIDPGGNWANRPAHSLTTIFMPWLPQTQAPVAKRKAAIRTVFREAPDSAWHLLLSLLPEQQQVSSYGHKPRWRKAAEDKPEKEVSGAEYWDQVTCYADFALDLAKGDPGRLKKLVEYLDRLPPLIFDKLLEHLELTEVTDLPEDVRMPVWSALVDFITKHHRFAGAKWAMGDDRLKRIKDVTAKLEPKSPFNRYRRLFVKRESALFEEKGNYQAQRKRLEERRETAVREIHLLGGVSKVLQFARETESPYSVGAAMGRITTGEDDAFLFPEMLLDGDESLAQFLAGYISARQWKDGWQWVDGTLRKDWPPRKIGQFLRCLPFGPETWKRASATLRDQDGEYWAKGWFNTIQAEEDFETAIDKFLQHNRPSAAIGCMEAASVRKKKPIDPDRKIRALMAAAQSEKNLDSMDVYQIVELIKSLQDDPTADQDSLFRIEWAYLPVLDGNHGTRPKLLELRLASDPMFFCEAIRTAFLSTHEKGDRVDPSERDQGIALNSFRLLREWKTPPGTLADGGFSAEDFTKWLVEAKRICEETGHYEVGMIEIGQVLTHTPADPGGLWINMAVAEALNEKDAEHLRSGLRSGYSNARGVHWVDPTGKPELDLAADFKKKADDSEEAGYHRLAAVMRSLSDEYQKEAERIVTEFKTKNV